MKKDRKCSVGKRIFRNYNFLKLLVLSPKQKRCKILQTATPDQLYSIIEVAANIVKYKNFCLKPSEKKLLRPYEKLLVELSDMNCSNQVKRLKQTGNGFWMALLIPVLAEITRTILNNV